jgi:hypothetical protein
MFNATETARKAASTIVDETPDSWLTQHEGIGCRGIHPDHVRDVANLIHATVAETIAGLIDAGSERDVVNENVELAQAIHNEVNGWIMPAPECNISESNHP